MTPAEKQFNNFISNQRTDISSLTVALHKNGKKYVASNTHYNAPYMERPKKERSAIKRKTARAVNQFLSRDYFLFLLSKKYVSNFPKVDWTVQMKHIIESAPLH